MTESEIKQKLDKVFRKNSNISHISTFKTITHDTKAKDLTEEQKLAFIAMMRMAVDPHQREWKRRLEQINARNESLPVEQRAHHRRKPADTVSHKRKRLRRKVAEMRSQKRFPLPAESRSDPARRYGFIPTSQRKVNLADYAKVNKK
ncbi:uncharacterized protein LOC131690918 [Topomyia yanbarensis]|uniref:uncharacterized protein LOC131690918 n=1 Tax=Topomyia yanbarensis TaxID=2498891 RepID=UPI00273CD416|nr:uncharacterized protein LOC131690918 [Topomyia yanbarensis]XP_058832991.1 uncharacterized protein LOC131690918 [Topomyia yanbarensis]